MVLPTALAMALDTRLLNGISIWGKPPKFEVSVACHLVTTPWPGTTRSKLSASTLSSVAGHSLALPPPG